jgi:hypothetical protein
MLSQPMVKLQTAPGFHDVVHGKIRPYDKGIPAAVGFAGMPTASAADVEDA